MAGIDVVNRGTRNVPGQRELALAWDDLVLVGDHHGRRGLDASQPRPGVVAAQRGDGLRDCPRAGRGELRQCPVVNVGGSQVECPTGRTGRRRPDAGARDAAQATHRQLHRFVEQALGGRGAEAFGAGAQDQARGSTRVLAPHSLGDDRPHREAGKHGALDAEQIEEGDCVVGAVAQRELLRLDPTAVPALVESDHAVPLGQWADRGVPGQQSGRSDCVQQHDGGRVRARPRRVGDVRRPAARKLDESAVGDDGPRQGDQLAKHGCGRAEHPCSPVLVSR